VKYFKNVFCFCLVLILPIGYYTGEGDTSNVWFRVGGGTGKYTTVIESCDEPPEHYSENFSDVGAALEIRPSDEQDIYFGVRGGHVSADIPVETEYGRTLEHGYINPHVSLETEDFGVGVGLVRNLGPRIRDELYWEIFDEILDIDPEIDFRRARNYLSGHARVGSYSSIYMIASLMEGTPIVSQYGYYMLGFGYGGVEDWHFASGLSGGFYDQGGFYMGMSHDLEGYGRPELSFRLGSSEDDFEGSISFAWTFTLK